ncbi:hypothetical protein H4R34_003659 [Dimargaris verticillata]|uniref:DH domain-containing protein n=1 Tax=Dimargaris verticillata TaxID=2761393 RepID=A0A9W8AZL1_9FUNG|nr:hypothetical protein H4R34_003659 [Dimargaris verticillata]
MAPLPASTRPHPREVPSRPTPHCLAIAHDRSPTNAGQPPAPQSADSDSDVVTTSPDPSTTTTDYGEELVVPPFMYLDLSNQHLDDLPLPHCHYQALNLSSNGLSHVPRSLFRHYATIRILVLSFNHLTDLPLDLVTLHSLTELYLNNNQLVHVPRCLGELRHLEVLDLSCNRLQALNYCLTRLQALRELDVSHNQLQEIPSYLGLLFKSLKTLGVSDNPLTKDASESLQPLILDAPMRPYARISHLHPSPGEPGALHATRLAPPSNRTKVPHHGARIPRKALQNPLSYDLAPRSDGTTASTESSRCPESVAAKPRAAKFARNPFSIFKPMKRSPSGSKRLHRHPKPNMVSLAPSLASSTPDGPLTPPATATPDTPTLTTRWPPQPPITPEPLGPTSPQTSWATTQACHQRHPTVPPTDAAPLFSDPGASEPATELATLSPDLATETTWPHSPHPSPPASSRKDYAMPERPRSSRRRASFSAVVGHKSPGASFWQTSSGESLSTPTSPELSVVASHHCLRPSLDRSQPTLLKKALINDHSHLHSSSSPSLPTADLDKPRSNRRWYSFWSAKHRSHREQRSAPTSPIEPSRPKQRSSSRHHKSTRPQLPYSQLTSTTETVEASPRSDYYSATSAASTQLQRASSARQMASVQSAPSSPTAQSGGSSQWEEVFFTPVSQTHHHSSYFPLTFPRATARAGGRTNRTTTPRSGLYASPPLSPLAHKTRVLDTPQQWSTKPEQDDQPTVEAHTPTSSLHSPSIRSTTGAASESRDSLPRVLDDPSALMASSASQVTPNDKLAVEGSQPTNQHRQISPLALASTGNSKVLNLAVGTSSTPSSSPAPKARATGIHHKPQLSVSSTASSHSEASAGMHSGASQLSVETPCTESSGAHRPLGDRVSPPARLLQSAGLRLKPSRSDITNKQSADTMARQPTTLQRQLSHDHFPPTGADGSFSAEYHHSVTDGHPVALLATGAHNLDHHLNQPAAELSTILNLMRDKWDLDSRSSESDQLQWHVKHGPTRSGDQTTENKLAMHRQSADPFNALVQYPINDTSTLNSSRSITSKGKQSSTNSSLTDVAGSEPTKPIDPEKRRRIFQELINTERTYVDCLRRLVKIYIGPIDPAIAQQCQVSLASSPTVARDSTTSLLPNSSELSLLSGASHTSAKQSFSSQLSDNLTPTTPSDPYLVRAGTAGPIKGVDSELATAASARRSSSTAVPEGPATSTNGFLQQLSATAAQFKPPPLSAALSSTLMRPPRLTTDGFSDWQSTKYRHLLSGAEIRTLFGNADTLLMFHRDHLLTDLEACVTDPSHPVGKVFLRNAAFLRLYSVYVNNYDSATTKLDEWTKDRKKFAKYLQAAQSHPEHNQLNLLGYLLLPIQRVPRYEMLLRQLLQHTPLSHPDYSDLCKALAVVKERAGEINEKKRGYERSVRMVQIANYIHGSHRINLVQPHRRFIRRGMLFLDTAVTTTTKLHKYPLGVKTHKVGLNFYFFLFNDLLLQCTKSEHSGCHLLKTLQLQSRVAPAELMQDQTTLRLVDETGIYYLRAKPGEAERWVSALNNRFTI